MNYEKSFLIIKLIRFFYLLLFYNKTIWIENLSFSETRCNHVENKKKKKEEFFFLYRLAISQPFLNYIKWNQSKQNRGIKTKNNAARVSWLLLFVYSSYNQLQYVDCLSLLWNSETCAPWRTQINQIVYKSDLGHQEIDFSFLFY